jgi:hypothetical protein
MVEGFARLGSIHFLPDDRDAADRALATATSIPDAGASELAKALSMLADALVPPPAAHRGRSRRRLLSRRR